MLRKMLILALLLLSLLALFGCGSSAPAAAGPEIQVTMEEWKITPAEIKVPANASVTLVVTNKGTQPHDLGLEGTKTATKLLQAGETQKLTFKTPAKGTSSIICTVAGHKESGMVAKLVAE